MDRLGASSVVEFAGATPHGDLIRRLARASVLIHPSATAVDGDSEGGAPTILLEAQAIGTPIVSTRHADIPNVVPEGAGVRLCREHDVEALADALVAACESRVASSPAYVTANHAVGLAIDRLENLYGVLVDRTRSRRLRNSVSRPARVTVVTSGHLSTCPRMLKSADALAAAGYEVTVVSTCHEPWAADADRDVRSRRTWPVHLVDYRPRESALTYGWTGAQHRAARVIVHAMGPDRAPLPVAARAFGRVHAALVRTVSAIPADLIYGGTAGALAAIAAAGHRGVTPYALDLEDFHSGETSGPEARFVGALATRIERAVLGDAAFLTTSSEAIAAAYREQYGALPSVVHNTFPLPAQLPDFTRADPGTLRFYWFSQTIGPGRGLEDAVTAIGRTGVSAELTLRGRPRDGYVEALTHLAAAQAPRLRLTHQPPSPPDAMVDLARGYDVGLALDHGTSRNRALCITNKAFTYILAGVAVAMSDTPGQHDLGADFGRAAALVPAGDVDALAGAFARWAADPAALDCAKRTAWQAAVRRWHWEHECERGVLYRLVGEALA